MAEGSINDLVGADRSDRMKDLDGVRLYVCDTLKGHLAAIERVIGEQAQAPCDCGAGPLSASF